MIKPGFVSAELSGGDQVWIDLHDFDSISLGMLADGSNVYHEFAKRRLRQMGFPDVLVDSGRYVLQRCPGPQADYA